MVSFLQSLNFESEVLYIAISFLKETLEFHNLIVFICNYELFSLAHLADSIIKIAFKDFTDKLRAAGCNFGCLVVSPFNSLLDLGLFFGEVDGLVLFHGNAEPQLAFLRPKLFPVLILIPIDFIFLVIRKDAGVIGIAIDHILLSPKAFKLLEIFHI